MFRLSRRFNNFRERYSKTYPKSDEVNLKIHPGKCAFLRKEVLYLGHIISDEGMRLDSEKSRVMKNFPVPQNSNDVKRFVACATTIRSS